MGIIRTQRIGKHLNTLEKYHIYKISKDNMHINDANIDTHNQVFRALQEMDTNKQHTRPTPYTKTKRTTQKHLPRMTALVGCQQQASAFTETLKTAPRRTKE
jgi:hypothetical protein